MIKIQIGNKCNCNVVGIFNLGNVVQHITPLYMTCLPSLRSYEESLRRSGISWSSVDELSDDGLTERMTRANSFLYSARKVPFRAP